MDVRQKGLNNFQIKIIALVLMTFDHIHYMFSNVLEVPMWFTIIGRISAPLFIFMLANGLAYTSNRMKYMSRLYIGFIGMNIMNSLAERYFPHPAGNMMIANIFSTMFLIGFFICVYEKLILALKEKKVGQIIGYGIALIAPFVVSAITMMLLSTGSTILFSVLRVIMIAVPNPILAEGGFFFIILGIGFYVCRNSKAMTGIFYGICCAFMFVVALQAGFTFHNLTGNNIQWFMVFALPIILMYNNQKGKSMKYFFYLYYPAHLYVLLAIVRMIGRA